MVITAESSEMLISQVNVLKTILILLKSPMRYNDQSFFFLTKTTNSSLLITSMFHSTISPTSRSKSLTTALGIVVLNEFEFGFALLTLVLYLNITISPYLFLVTIIYVLSVIYIFTFKNTTKSNTINNIKDNIKKVTFIYYKVQTIFKEQKTCLEMYQIQGTDVPSKNAYRLV